MPQPTGFHPQQTLPAASDGEMALATLTRSGSADAAMFRESVETARRFPRNEAVIMRTLLATLTEFPQFAEKAIYSIPFKEVVFRGGERIERTVKVEGLTIRAAEMIAAQWGNLLLRAEILGEDDSGWDLQAGIFDLQTNYRLQEPARASKWLKRRDGRMEQLDDRRQIMACNAAVSKAMRNVVLRILPLHVKAAFELKVREILAGGPLNKPANPEKVAAAVAAFQADYGVAEERLVGFIGKPRNVWTGADLAELRAVYAALHEGETTVEAVFPSTEAEAPPAEAPPGRVVDAQDGVFVREPKPEPNPEAPPPKAAAEPRPPREPKTRPAKPPAPEPATAASESEIAQLRRKLAEAEAKAAPVGPAPPAPAPAPAPALSAAAQEQLDLCRRAIAECQTLDTLDAFLGGLYEPTRGILPEVRKAVMPLIGERRDAIQRQAAP